MSNRLINRQRQLAEQGRLRLGYTVEAKNKKGETIQRPVRSETWIVTSHSREHVERAAELWDGDVHEWQPLGNGAKQWRVITQAKAIPAILPPGDPLTQSYEMWSRGGCQRRCSGATEELSGSPCICLAQFGETWFERSPREVCSTHSRLKVLLPDMPGLGSWRMETGSYYATDEIAGMVDTIRGAVGDAVLVPVVLRIEPRTRVANGETKQFVVPVLDLRDVTAGALLSGQAAARGQLLTGDRDSTTPLALQQAKGEDAYTPYFVAIDGCDGTDSLTAIWHDMVAEGLLGEKVALTPRIEEFTAAFRARAVALKAAGGQVAGDGAGSAAPSPQSPAPDAEGVVEAELVDEPDADAVWAEIVKVAGDLGDTLPQVQDDVAAFLGGTTAGEASGAELQSFLDDNLMPRLQKAAS